MISCLKVSHKTWKRRGILLKALIIYNPHAGHGRARKLLPIFKDYLQQKEIEAEVLLTTHQGHGVQLCREADFSSFDVVIASGGDGTVFEVLNGYYQNNTETKPPFAIVPNGTGNAFVRDMGLAPGDWKRAIDILLLKTIREIDVARFKTTNAAYYYLNIVGFGFVSEVNEASLKYKRLGNAAYILAVFTSLAQLKTYPLTIEMDGHSIQRENVFVEVSNSRYTGTNFLMAPNAELDDGLLDITLLNKISRFKILKVFPSIFKGEHTQFEEIETFQAKKIKITTDNPMKLSADGELLGETPIAIDCLHKDLKIFWPE